MKVAVTPQVTSVAPGSNLKVSVTVADSQDLPCDNAEVLLFAVDESVLELAGYSILDPLLSFFARHPSNSSGMPTYFNQIMIRDYEIEELGNLEK